MVEAWALGIFFGSLLIAIMAYYVYCGYVGISGLSGRAWTLFRLLRKLPIVNIDQAAVVSGGGNITQPMTADKVCHDLLNEFSLPYLREFSLQHNTVHADYGGSYRTVFRVGSNEYQVLHYSNYD